MSVYVYDCFDLGCWAGGCACALYVAECESQVSIFVNLISLLNIKSVCPVVFTLKRQKDFWSIKSTAIIGP
ncbi:hypothetical protein JZ751_008182 [Albula glossodonta]|uniref:Uncharacterized protein n=1 Tax=Albula glossodonta TaxID=121402 RepID=A0A8T2N2L0_9TELE|nr:hypothetical protein JZ751_008182 [Albula glossodonta]